MVPVARIDPAFVDALREYFPENSKSLVAVSGGRDSMALLHLLQGLKRADHGEFLVGHLNHLLRGEESNRDEAFVSAEARRYGLAFESARIDVRAFATRRNLSLETAARECRYAWLAEVADQHGCARAVTAHHADDQVETILINLFRGSGSRGLAGMKDRSLRDVDGRRLEIIRPLLPIFREEIDRYLLAHKIPFREDESNRDEFALRNRVRNRLLPTIKDVFQRDVRPAVLRAAELARLDEAWAESALGAPPDSGEGLEVGALRDMPEAQRDRTLLSWLRRNEVPGCGYREVKKVAEVVLATRSPAKANLPAGYHVRRRSGVLFLEWPSTPRSKETEDH